MVTLHTFQQPARLWVTQNAHYCPYSGVWNAGLSSLGPTDGMKLSWGSGGDQGHFMSLPKVDDWMTSDRLSIWKCRLFSIGLCFNSRTMLIHWKFKLIFGHCCRSCASFSTTLAGTWSAGGHCRGVRAFPEISTGSPVRFYEATSFEDDLRVHPDT